MLKGSETELYFNLVSTYGLNLDDRLSALWTRIVFQQVFNKARDPGVDEYWQRGRMELDRAAKDGLLSVIVDYPRRDGSTTIFYGWYKGRFNDGTNYANQDVVLISVPGDLGVRQGAIPLLMLHMPGVIYDLVTATVKVRNCLGGRRWLRPEGIMDRAEPVAGFTWRLDLGEKDRRECVEMLGQKWIPEIRPEMFLMRKRRK